MFVRMIYRDMQNRITENTGIYVQEYEEKKVANQHQM